MGRMDSDRIGEPLVSGRASHSVRGLLCDGSYFIFNFQ